MHALSGPLFVAALAVLTVTALALCCAASPDEKPQEPADASSTGLIPLTEMSGDDRYKDQDGGLYGSGINTPPTSHRQAAERRLADIQPLATDGTPAPDGRIVVMSLGMSNTTMEFSAFMAMSEEDPQRANRVTLVDGATGSMDVLAWADNTRYPNHDNKTTWEIAKDRLAAADVTPEQVQILWIKLTKMAPGKTWGPYPVHTDRMREKMVEILNQTVREFPNLKIAYLSNRTYGGYAQIQLNPEPYAYENAFAVRALIAAQIAGDARLNHDPAAGPVNSPLLLWGPYLWADGLTPRKADGLIYERADFKEDGTHPSEAGCAKVGRQLLHFFQTNPLARTWYRPPQ